MTQSNSLSFEFFPPADAAAALQLAVAVERLASFNPDFVSVTYGADGSSRGRTVDCVRNLRRSSGLIVVPHVTGVGSTRAEIGALADHYWSDGCRRLIVLRGDVPSGAGTGAGAGTAVGDYAYASELVLDLAARHDFELLVAAYPEGHPETGSVAADIENLKRKVDAGARGAITQFFFDTDAFLRYRDLCRAAGLAIPIVPGILPIRRFDQVERFAARCGASIPGWLRRRFEAAGADGVSAQSIAVQIASEQVLRLKSHGIEDFHFYTLNHAELTRAVCEASGFRPCARDQCQRRFG